MPKQKVHKGLKSRVQVSSRGKVLRRHAGMRHLMSGKPGKTRRQLRRKTKVHRSETKRFRRLLGIG